MHFYFYSTILQNNLVIQTIWHSKVQVQKQTTWYLNPFRLLMGHGLYVEQCHIIMDGIVWTLKYPSTSWLVDVFILEKCLLCIFFTFHRLRIYCYAFGKSMMWAWWYIVFVHLSTIFHYSFFCISILTTKKRIILTWW